MSSPEPKPNKINNDEVKNKSSLELHQAGYGLISDMSMSIYSSASLVASCMLGADYVILDSDKSKCRTTEPFNPFNFLSTISVSLNKYLSND